MTSKKTWEERYAIFKKYISTLFSEEESKSKQALIDLYKKAQLKCKINKNDSALALYKKADASLQKKDFNIEQRKYIDVNRYPKIAYIYYCIGDYENALAYTNKTISCLSEIDKEFEIFNLNKIRQVQNIIRIVHKQKRYDEFFDWNLFLLNYFIFNIVPNDDKVNLLVDLIPFVPDKIFTNGFNDVFLELIVKFNIDPEISYEKVHFFNPFINRKNEINQDKFEIFYYFIQCLSSINSGEDSIVDKLLASNDDADYLLVKILLYALEIRKYNQSKNDKDLVRVENLQQKILAILNKIEGKNKRHVESIKLKLSKNGILRSSNKSGHATRLKLRSA